LARTDLIINQINLDLKEDSSVLCIELLSLDADIPFTLFAGTYNVAPAVLIMIRNLAPNLLQTKLSSMSEGTSSHKDPKGQLITSA
jgi:hypothetical protein